MAKHNKQIISVETLPYLNLFDLNKLWLDLKQERGVLIAEVREIRKKGYNLTTKINEIETKISEAIAKLTNENGRS